MLRHRFPFIPPQMVNVGKYYRLSVVLGALVLANGCRPVPPEIASQPLPVGGPAEVEIDQLQAKIDRILQFTLDERPLTTENHAAWQILHGSLAFGKSFPVLHEGKPVSVIDHLSLGGPMQGWTVERGYRLKSQDENQPPRFGMRAVVEPGTRAGQGHHDQWLAVLSQCELPPNHEILVGDATYTMSDFVRQVQLDTSRNVQHEFSWTLIGLTAYYPTDHEWTDAMGHTWTIEDLVAIEVEQGLEGAACGGSHRLIGLAMALNRHVAKGGKVDGVWLEAQQLIQQQGIALAKQYQHPSGALSVNYFERAGTSPDLAENLNATGHTLEFLAIALTEEQLREPWVVKSVNYLCDVFARTEQVSLECGSLYHAAHGLVLYRQRVYGPHSYEPNLGDATGATSAVLGDAS